MLCSIRLLTFAVFTQPHIVYASYCRVCTSSNMKNNDFMHYHRPRQNEKKKGGGGAAVISWEISLYNINRVVVDVGCDISWRFGCVCVAREHIAVFVSLSTMASSRDAIELFTMDAKFLIFLLLKQLFLFFSRMAADSDGYTNDLTAVVICEGDYHDPKFPQQLKNIVARLNSLVDEQPKLRRLKVKEVSEIRN